MGGRGKPGRPAGRPVSSPTPCNIPEIRKAVASRNDQPAPEGTHQRRGLRLPCGASRIWVSVRDARVKPKSCHNSRSCVPLSRLSPGVYAAVPTPRRVVRSASGRLVRDASLTARSCHEGKQPIVRDAGLTPRSCHRWAAVRRYTLGGPLFIEPRKLRAISPICKLVSP